MTAFREASSSTQKVPGIPHKCLHRKSRRTYELLNPRKPSEVVSFDIGQIREIVRMDKRLREDDAVACVPAGYTDFAALFNAYAAGPERFATFVFIDEQPVIFKDGSPIVWEHFLIDDSLVPSHLDEPVAGPSISVQPTITTTTTTTAPRNASSGSIFVEAAGSSNALLQPLSTHMKGALATTDELTNFWIERGAIEHQYASRLAKLAERPIGQNEPSEFRSAIDGLRVETAKQSMTHNTLATQIAVELESRCLEMQASQRVHLRDVYAPAARRLQEETGLDSASPHAGVSSEWKREYRNIRHSLDLRRLDAMRGRQGGPLHLDDLEFTPGRSGNPPRQPAWRKREWEDLRDSCEEMEAGRSRFMKDVLAAYADVWSSIRTVNNESYETIIRTNDLFRPEDVVEEFTQHFGESGSDSDDVRRHALTPAPANARPHAAGSSDIARPRPASVLGTPTLPSRPLPDPPAANEPRTRVWWDDPVRARAMGINDHTFTRTADTRTGASGSGHRPSKPNVGAKLPLTVARTYPVPAPTASMSVSVSTLSRPSHPLPRSTGTGTGTSTTRPRGVLLPAMSTNLNPTRNEQRGVRPSLPKITTNFLQRKNPV